MMNSVLPLLLCLIFFCSCGKKRSNTSSEKQHAEDRDGIYYGVLYPINPTINKQVNGFIKITKYGDELTISVKASGLGKNLHYQYLHSEKHCPKTDFNADGIIDAQEVLKQTGKLLLPLDMDISTHWTGRETFPFGNYDYVQSTSYYLLLTDLQSIKTLENAEITKIKQDTVEFGQRSLIIYGALKPPNLPSTVHTLEGRTVENSIPVACAAIEYKIDGPEYFPSAEREVIPRPRPHHPTVEYHPQMPPSREPTSWWSRLTEKLRKWWCRVRHRCE